MKQLVVGTKAKRGRAHDGNIRRAHVLRRDTRHELPGIVACVEQTNHMFFIDLGEFANFEINAPNLHYRKE